MAIELNRRSTDNQSLDINQLIADESDPKQRAFLIVLHNINLNLEANTKTIRDIGDRLEEHITKFTDHANNEHLMVAQGKGAWKVMAWVLGVAQLMVIGLWTTVKTDLASLNAHDQQFEVGLVQLMNRVDILEKKVK